MAARSLRTGVLGLLLLAACQREAPATPGAVLSGQLLVPGKAGSDQPVAGEVQLVAEAAMAPHLSRRGQEAAAERERGRAEREALEAEHARLLAVQDRADARWRELGDTDLHRRLALRVRPGSPEEMRAAEQRFRKEKKAVYAEARAAARRAHEKEQELLALRLGSEQQRSCGFYLAGLPPAAAAVRAGDDGRFEVQLPPGRYAAVGRAAGADGRESCWILWAAAAPGATVLRLDGKNTLGSRCRACAVPAEEEAAARPRVAGQR